MGWEAKHSGIAKLVQACSGVVFRHEACSCVFLFAFTFQRALMKKVRRSETTDLMKSQSLFPVRDHWDSPLLEPSQAPNHRPSFIFFLDMRVLSSMLLLYSVLFGMMIEVSRFCFLRPMGCEPFKAADISAYPHIISHIISHEVPTMWCPLVVNGFINPIIVISTINIHKP